MPIRQTVVPHTGHLPLVMGLPFLVTPATGSAISRFALHFTQYASIGAPFSRARPASYAGPLSVPSFDSKGAACDVANPSGRENRPMWRFSGILAAWMPHARGEHLRHMVEYPCHIGVAWRRYSMPRSVLPRSNAAKEKPRQAPSLRGLLAGVYPLRNGLPVIALLLLTGIAIIEV